MRNSEEASGCQRILVQLDRSEQAESALPRACKLARLNHAEIALLRVAEYPFEVSSKCNSQTLVDRGLAEKMGAEIEACCSEKGKRCYSQPTCRRASRHSLAGQTAKSTKTPDPSVTVQWVRRYPKALSMATVPMGSVYGREYADSSYECALAQ